MKYYLLALSLFLLPVFTFAFSSQDAWIESLHQCESRGRDYITILDSNNKYSYGGLQFQLDTFLAFGKKYNILPDDMTRVEGKLLIHNIGIQKAIAREMLDDGLSSHWRNCANKIGPYPQVEN